MKITARQLRNIIKEEVSRILAEGEAYKVTYKGKDGKTQTVTFPKKNLADMYAKNYKDAVVEPVDADVRDIDVKKMPAAGLDDLRASAKSFYKSAKAGEKFNPRGKTTDLGADSEHAAEQEAEFWAASRAAGQSTADAYRDLDYERKHTAFRKKLGMMQSESTGSAPRQRRKSVKMEGIDWNPGQDEEMNQLSTLIRDVVKTAKRARVRKEDLVDEISSMYDTMWVSG